MSNIWKFSSLSEPYLEKWLQKAVSIENSNKWSEKFKHVNQSYLEYYNYRKLKEENVTEKPIDDAESFTAQIAMDTTEIAEEVLTKQNYDENFFNMIESEPLSRLEYMTEECLKNPNLISQLAEHLSTNVIEKICNSIFSNNINSEFISLFLLNFFPTFLKRDQSWLALDLLIKANKTYPEQFKLVLIELIKNIDIKSTILLEFMQNSNVELQKYFMSVLMHINVTSDIFLHHLHTIHTVYKDYRKTENVQVFMQSMLMDNAVHCTNDKNYGRLFLTFLQAQKTLGLPINCTILERVINLHKSLFKRPCLSILYEMKQ